MKVVKLLWVGTQLIPMASLAKFWFSMFCVCFSLTFVSDVFESPSPVRNTKIKAYSLAHCFEVSQFWFYIHFLNFVICYLNWFVATVSILALQLHIILFTKAIGVAPLIIGRWLQVEGKAWSGVILLDLSKRWSCLEYPSLMPLNLCSFALSQHKHDALKHVPLRND